MASGMASTVLAALKTKAAVAVLTGAVVVGGGATAVAVTTGAVQLPGRSTTSTQHDGTSTQDGRTQACANNGDANQLAADYKAMFGGDKKAARDAICQIFIGKDGPAVGFGEIRQALNLAAWIESKGGSATCLTAAPANGSSSGDHGQPTGTPGAGGDHGKPTGTPGAGGDHGQPTGTPDASGDHGQPTGTPGQESSAGQTQLTIPSASAATSESILTSIFKTEKGGTPIAQQARACGAPHSVSDTGSDSSAQDKSDATPEATEASTPEATEASTPEATEASTPEAHS